MLSASNIPLPENHDSDLPPNDRPTTVLLLPSFTFIDDVTPAHVPNLMTNYVSTAPTTMSPLGASLPPSIPSSTEQSGVEQASLPATFPTRPCQHGVLILLCSQKTRDARCGQSAPLLKKELERHLRPLGLYRDASDTRPGGVGIYFISHVGGHKYSANAMVYRRAGFGTIAKAPAKERSGVNGHSNGTNTDESIETPTNEGGENTDPGAAQCIWLARIRPEDCEGLVKFTVMQGKVVKPESQLRGGFDRSKGLVSW